MNRYKIFRGVNEDSVQVLSSRVLKSENKEDYYKLIAEENEKGNKQLILTRDIILKTTFEYILKNKYDLVSIETDNQELNERLIKYIDKAEEDRGYLVAVVLELEKDEDVDINKLTIQKYDETITFHINGIVSTNTTLESEMLDAITRSYLGYIS